MERLRKKRMRNRGKGERANGSNKEKDNGP